MDFTEGCGEFELIITVRDHLFDNIGTKADSPYILQTKPHLVTNIILWGFTVVGIVESGHVVGCLG